MKLKNKNKTSTIKPWDRLGLSRQQYFNAHPWTKAKMKRKVFEELLLLMPDHFIQETLREGEADALVEAIFGAGALDGEQR